MALPAPKVPDLQPENWIDLDQLGSDDLLTWIDYPGIAEGDEIFPNWRGCGADGSVRDLLMSSTPVVGLEPEGFAYHIPNALLHELDQGWVFYSYFIADLVQPGQPGEESLRRFFYVGQRDRPAGLPGLGVPQFRESHDLQVVLEWITGNSATVVVPPYVAMSVGDQVTLTLALYFGENDPFDDLVLKKTLTAAELRLPLTWSVPRNELEVIEDGYLEARYQIDYATPTIPTQGPMQRLDVVSKAIARLPAVTIEGFGGGSLDPERYPDGITLLVEPYIGMQPGDDVLLHASGSEALDRSVRVDASVVDSGLLAFRVGHSWLVSNNGKPVTFSWQYARGGASGSGEPLAVMIRKPLDLPSPVVEGAEPEDPVDGVPRGYLFAINITGGVFIRVPDDAQVGPDDDLEMHWQGHGSTGSVVVTEPMIGTPRRFFVPPAAIPANMGQRLDVFYRVTPAGQEPAQSSVFDLKICGMTSGWPAIQVRSPAQSRPLSLAQVPEAGALLALSAWPYMAVRQLVRVSVQGVTAAGQQVQELLRWDDDEPVTEDEYQAGELLVILSRPFLQGLALGQPFILSVGTSFDDGTHYISFPDVSIQLVG
ncbi:hypothetical protein RRX38_06185 [Pseudomonas sp. DTU_2021_1001937_2_SI_NGA_ILE_001]|uniref:hypothetical protein n=1 Tax=Pseudomonas sp. DTU_2021_1001937_2_SI_NGA_ILE_001 TaxID=3077589 RepID=UPI0028FC21F3|nr:hypothetical protein [Pseudomonas sp. DTU_2021_1001937_2_SI_NGA_ILE_001]WNW10760.1 hypothetical protein RRX38_06185 [Pseudomonas sp. DTU_2021_1001937_2_SI_NGA_ILE_001]